MESPKNRIQYLLQIDIDATAIGLIADVLKKALDYVNAVNTLEHYVLTDNNDMEVVLRLDQRRTLAHNAIIDSVIIANRYLFKHYLDQIPPGGVYSDDPLHLRPVSRRAIGNWAGALVCDIYNKRR